MSSAAVILSFLRQQYLPLEVAFVGARVTSICSSREEPFKELAVSSYPYIASLSDLVVLQPVPVHPPSILLLRRAMLTTWRPDRSWWRERAHRDYRVRLGPFERAG